MSGGGKTSTSTSSVQIPPEVLARYNAVNQYASQVAQTPYQPYQGQFVAPMTGTQNAAVANINQAAGQAQPYFTGATEALLQGQQAATPYYGAAMQAYGGAYGLGAQLGQESYGAITGAQAGAQPYNQMATGLALAGTQAVNPTALDQGAVNQYMSPYLNNVVGSTMAAMNQQNQQQQSQLAGNAIQAGAFGGDRAGVAAANLAYQQNLANQQTIANLYNTGYGQALQTAQQQQGVGLAAQQANRAALQAGAGQLLGIGQQGYAQGAGTAAQLAGLGQQQFGQGLTAGQQIAGLGQGVYGMGQQTAQNLAALGTGAQTAALQGAQAQMAAGTQQQQTQQAQNTALYNQYLQQQGYPFQVAQFLAGIAEGTGALSGSTTTTTQPASFFSDRRLKENVKEIGETFDGQPIYRYNYKGHPGTQIGLMAQDVEHHHPEAVGVAGGYKTVDYDRATDEAAHRGHFAYGGESMGGGVVPERAGEGFAFGGAPTGSQDDFRRALAAAGLLPDSSQSPYGAGFSTPGSGGFMPRQVQPPSRGLMVAQPPAQKPPGGLGAFASDVNQVANLGENTKKLYERSQGAWDWLSNKFKDDTTTASAAHGGAIDRHGYATRGAVEPYGVKSFVPDDDMPDISGLKTAGAPSGGRDGNLLADLSLFGGGISGAQKIAGLVLPFFASSGGLVPRHGYAEGGGPDDTEDYGPTSVDAYPVGEARNEFGRRPPPAGWAVNDRSVDNDTKPIVEPAPGDYSSWSARAQAKYPPEGATVLRRKAVGLSPEDVGGSNPIPGSYEPTFWGDFLKGGIPANMLRNVHFGDLPGSDPSQSWLDRTGLYYRPGQVDVVPNKPNAQGQATVPNELVAPGLAGARLGPQFGPPVGLSPEDVGGANPGETPAGVGPAGLGRDTEDRTDRAGFTPAKTPPAGGAQATAVGPGRYAVGQGVGVSATPSPTTMTDRHQPMHVVSGTGDLGAPSLTNPPPAAPNQTPSTVSGGAGAGGMGDWFSRNQSWLVPLLSGVGTMAASPSRFLGAALLQGVGGAASAYENVQNQMAQRAKMETETALLPQSMQLRQQELDIRKTEAGIKASEFIKSNYKPQTDANNNIIGYTSLLDGKTYTPQQMGSVYQNAFNLFGGAQGGSPLAGGTISPPQAPSAPSVGTGIPLTVRTNNPGAIKDSNFARSMPGYAGSENGFASFKTPEDGRNAQIALLQSYATNNGLVTPQQIISRWASEYQPGHPNYAEDQKKVANYISAVSSQLGIKPTDPIDFRDPQAVGRLADAMATFERGPSPVGGQVTSGAPTQQQAPTVPTIRTQFDASVEDAFKEVQRLTNLQRSSLGGGSDKALEGLLAAAQRRYDTALSNRAQALERQDVLFHGLYKETNEKANAAIHTQQIAKSMLNVVNNTPAQNWGPFSEQFRNIGAAAAQLGLPVQISEAFSKPSESDVMQKLNSMLTGSVNQETSQGRTLLAQWANTAGTSPSGAMTQKAAKFLLENIIIPKAVHEIEKFKLLDDDSIVGNYREASKRINNYDVSFPIFSPAATMSNVDRAKAELERRRKAASGAP